MIDEVLKKNGLNNEEAEKFKSELKQRNLKREITLFLPDKLAEILLLLKRLFKNIPYR